MPDVATGRINVKNNAVDSMDLPSDVAENRQIILLDPIVGSGNSSIAAIRALKARGVKEENILLVTITLSENAADRLREFGDMKIVSASIDVRLDEGGMLVPGMGWFEKRYSD